MSKSGAEIEKDIHAALGRVKLMAKGLWYVVRYTIEDQTGRPGHRPGHLQADGRPISAAQLAIMAGCSAETLSRPLQQLLDAGLLDQNPDGVLHSAILARLHDRRARGADRVRRSRNADSKALGGRGALRNTFRGVTNTVRNTHVTPRARSEPLSPPSEGSPPTTPSPNPPPSLPFPDAIASGAQPLRSGFEPKPPEKVPGETPAHTAAAKRRPRKRSDEQVRIFEEFVAWWCNSAVAWKRVHRDAEYDFNASDGDPQIVWWALDHRSIAFDLEKLKAIALLYLELPEFNGNQGHALKQLRWRMKSLLIQWSRRQTEGSSHVLKPTTADLRTGYQPRLSTAGVLKAIDLNRAAELAEPRAG